MSLLSVMTFPAAGALRRGHLKPFIDERASPTRANERFELISVLVASKDALRARKALWGCPGASILACLPMHKGDNVKLEVRFPAGQGDEVIGRILACLPDGEIGGIVACASPSPRPRRDHANVFHLHEF